MRTAGAVLFALVIMTVLNYVYGLVSGFLVAAIYSSTGVIWLPVVLTCAIGGAASYGGVAGGLAIFKKADAKITFGVVVGFLSLATIANEFVIYTEGKGALAMFVFALNYLVVLLGCYVAMKTAGLDDE